MIINARKRDSKGRGEKRSDIKIANFWINLRPTHARTHIRMHRIEAKSKCGRTVRVIVAIYHCDQMNGPAILHANANVRLIGWQNLTPHSNELLLHQLVSCVCVCASTLSIHLYALIRIYNDFENSICEISMNLLSVVLVPRLRHRQQSK